MALSVSLRPSTDATSTITIGTDGGLYALRPTAGRYSNLTNAIDNSWSTPAANTTYYYATPTGLTANVAQVPTTALIWPLLLTRKGVITAAYANATNTTTGVNWFHTLYAADASTGLPAAKITDLFRFTTAGATYLLTGTNVDSATVLGENTLYWVASWTSGNATFVTRAPAPANQFRTFTSNATAMLTQYTAYTDSTQAWSTTYTSGVGPATLAGVVTASSPLGNAPMLWFGVKNV